MDYKLTSIIISLGVPIIGCLIAIGKLMQQIKQLEKREVITRSECLLHTNTCRSSLDEKFVNILEALKIVREDFKTSQREHNSELQKISKFMGAVEQFMKG